MCIEDIRLGRKLGAQAKAVNVVLATSTPVVQADPMRTRLVFATTGGQCRFAPQGIDPLLEGAFSVQGTLPPIVLTVEQYGKLVTLPWNAAAVVADVLCLVIEETLGVE